MNFSQWGCFLTNYSIKVNDIWLVLEQYAIFSLTNYCSLRWRYNLKITQIYYFQFKIYPCRRLLNRVSQCFIQIHKSFSMTWLEWKFKRSSFGNSLFLRIFCSTVIRTVLIKKDFGKHACRISFQSLDSIVRMDKISLKWFSTQSLSKSSFIWLVLERYAIFSLRKLLLSLLAL